MVRLSQGRNDDDCGRVSPVSITDKVPDRKRMSMYKSVTSFDDVHSTITSDEERKTSLPNLKAGHNSISFDYALHASNKRRPMLPSVKEESIYSENNGITFNTKEEDGGDDEYDGDCPCPFPLVQEPKSLTLRGTTTRPSSLGDNSPPSGIGIRKTRSATQHHSSSPVKEDPRLPLATFRHRASPKKLRRMAAFRRRKSSTTDSSMELFSPNQVR